jgi:F0F1-type ATP synthase assembly protein I
MDSLKSSISGEKRKFYYIVAIGGQVTILLVGPVVFCLLLGFWLDSYFHTSPFFIILGVILGFIGSIFNVFRVMKIIDKM